MKKVEIEGGYSVIRYSTQGANSGGYFWGGADEIEWLHDKFDPSSEIYSWQGDFKTAREAAQAAKSLAKEYFWSLPQIERQPIYHGRIRYDLQGLPRPGGQPGNQNAEKEEPLDGRLDVRLPRQMIAAMKEATYVTGDRGIAALMRRLIQQELDRLEIQP